jgi:hypothetical protein
MSKTFKQVSSDFIKLSKEAPSCEGFLVESLDMPVEGRTRPGVLLKTEDGKILKVPLGEAMRGELALLEKGAYYKFTFLGTEASRKGNDVKKFKIEIADEE